MLRHLSCTNRDYYPATGASFRHFDVRTLLAVPLPTVQLKNFSNSFGFGSLSLGIRPF